MTAYFMGVAPGEDAGHYCVSADGRSACQGVRTPWADVAGPLGDATATRAAWPEGHDGYGCWRYPTAQPEGLARVVRKDGWTLVSLWDRSADHRHGSHASFALPADLEPASALETARELFPAVFERIERHLGRPVVLAPEAP